MKKNLCIFFALTLWFVSAGSVFANDAQSTSDTTTYVNTYEMIPINEYNETYSNSMLAIDEYNETYSKDALSSSSSEMIGAGDASAGLLSTLSETKTQTKDVVLTVNQTVVGTVKLEYKTWIVGGRPQFAYDYCKISKPMYNTYWGLVESEVFFTGDRITVYYNFVHGPMEDTAYVYFYPL